MYQNKNTQTSYFKDIRGTIWEQNGLSICLIHDTSTFLLEAYVMRRIGKLCRKTEKHRVFSENCVKV